MLNKLGIIFYDHDFMYLFRKEVFRVTFVIGMI